MKSVLRSAAQIAAAYVLLFAVTAWLGQWDPTYLEGRDLWHFTISRMIVPMLALAVLASFARIIPAALLLAAMLLFVGAMSAIKREATGEPFQLSDLFLAGQSHHLLSYVGWDKWLMGFWLLPALILYFRSLRFRRMGIPVAIICMGILSTYRIEVVAKFIHDYAAPYGLENLTFSQAESERMNGLATHLYFSSAGLWLETFTPQDVEAAMEALNAPPPTPASAVKPDIYLVLGEAWWRDPSDADSPLNMLEAQGFAEATAISPVYGGTTPNAEFEVLTGIPMKSFRSGIIPYQHYSGYFTENTVTLARLLRQKGYRTHAYHNFTARFWLRDQVYPRFGFETFDSAGDMGIALGGKDQWPSDAPLFRKVLERTNSPGPEFHYIVTVSTHGPYPAGPDCTLPGKNGACNYRTRLKTAVSEFALFTEKVKARGRPYVIVVFGDHLPGIRNHQIALGIKRYTEPRMYRVPVLAASNVIEAAVLRDALAERPFPCFSPVIAEKAGLGVRDRYFRHMVRACAEGAPPLPDPRVIQRQLFD